MNTPTRSFTPAGPPPRFRTSWAWLVIALAGLAAYANSLSGPFIFDDVGSIVENQSLRSGPSWEALAPPGGGLTVSGRPLLNLTLAINHALGGTQVWGYHAGNLAIHLLAGLTLFGLARWTLARCRLGWAGLKGALATDWLALAIALLWTLHPLQTEAVTYVVQRAESLMGLCYLLTLYCFARGTEEGRGASSLWFGLSWLACLGGMATKEVMVSAPVVVLLYDRTFIGGSFAEAWRRRRSVHLGLAATWILLLGLVAAGGGGRGGSAGLGSGVSWWAYGLTQFEAIARYLRLAVWPHPLVFEYGTFWVHGVGQVLPSACVVLSLVAVTGVALRRWPAWGFLGFWFLAVLAPTSLIPGTTQMVVEHRMYLALAPLLAAVVVGGAVAAGRGGSARAVTTWLFLLFVLAGCGGVATARRNRDYRTELRLWADTVSKRPGNALAHNNLGTMLEDRPGRLHDAIVQFQEALRLDPRFQEAHNNLGNAWLREGKLDAAMAEYQEALRLRPDFAAAHNDYGNALSHLPGRRDEAISEYEAALRLKPGYAGAHNNLGKAWLETPGKLDGAIAQFQEALRLQPDFAEAHNNLGNAWANQPGKLGEAMAQFQEAIRLQPDLAEAHNNLGNAWSQLPGRMNDAVAQLEEALLLRPAFAEAHNNLGNAWLQTAGKLDEAVAQYQAALALKPDYAEAHYNLAVALLQQPDRSAEARRQLEAFLRLRPDNAEALQLLATLPAPPP
jgi:tetratricopeptide (TPR) repeat protein